MLLLRNGWYCSEHELNLWWDLAGWRGLQTPAVREHFSNTFYSFGGPDDTDWGPNADLMKNLNLNYTLNFMGENADAILADRLRSVLPTLLYLWSPHPLLAMYQLNRISLPTYKNQALFDQGITDFPTDTLEKVASKTLAELAPRVYQMYSRFGLENSDQVDMLDNAERLGSTMQAACAWLTSPEHVDTWREGWIPKEEFTCNAGQYMIDGAVPRCEDCPKGTKGAGGKVTACTSCAPGAAMRLRLCVLACVEEGGGRLGRAVQLHSYRTMQPPRVDALCSGSVLHAAREMPRSPHGRTHQHALQDSSSRRKVKSAA